MAEPPKTLVRNAIQLWCSSDLPGRPDGPNRVELTVTDNGRAMELTWDRENGWLIASLNVNGVPVISDWSRPDDFKF